MPDMYEVYSQQRPGHPRWALGSSAILLLLTVALAAALVHYKTSPGGVTFEPFATAGLKGKRPAGWKEIAGEVPGGTRIALVEPTAEGAKGRRLFVFRRRVLPVGPPDRIADRVVRTYAAELIEVSASMSGQMTDESERPGSSAAPIDGLKGVSVRLKFTPRQGPSLHCLARAAMISPIEVLGVALLTTGEAGATESRLLDRVSRELQVVALAPGLTPGDESAGVRAGPPVGLTAFTRRK